MSLWGNKNRVRELEYIMVILMISQQMQPEKHSEHNQVKCSNDKLALFTALPRLPTANQHPGMA
jgi:hypothetical protein